MDAYSQTWHLPCDEARLTYKQLINLVSDVYSEKFSYITLKMWMFKTGGLFNKQLKEVQELLPRYKHDNIFVSGKFQKGFPHFAITTYRQGITAIMNEQRQQL